MYQGIEPWRLDYSLHEHTIYDQGLNFKASNGRYFYSLLMTYSFMIESIKKKKKKRVNHVRRN